MQKCLQKKQEFLRASPSRGEADAWARLRGFLEARHPVKTAEAVEAATRGRVKAGAYRQAQRMGTGFSGIALLHLIGTYGPDLLAAVYGPRPGWARHAPETDPRDARLADLARQLMELSRGNA